MTRQHILRLIYSSGVHTQGGVCVVVAGLCMSLGFAHCDMRSAAGESCKEAHDQACVLWT